MLEYTITAYRSSAAAATAKCTRADSASLALDVDPAGRHRRVQPSRVAPDCGGGVHAQGNRARDPDTQVLTQNRRSACAWRAAGFTAAHAPHRVRARGGHR